MDVSPTCSYADGSTEGFALEQRSAIPELRIVSNIHGDPHLLALANSAHVRTLIEDVVGQLLPDLASLEFVLSNRFEDSVRAALRLTDPAMSFHPRRGASITTGKTIELPAGDHRIVLDARLLRTSRTADVTNDAERRRAFQHVVGHEAMHVVLAQTGFVRSAHASDDGPFARVAVSFLKEYLCEVQINRIEEFRYVEVDLDDSAASLAEGLARPDESDDSLHQIYWNSVAYVAAAVGSDGIADLVDARDPLSAALLDSIGILIESAEGLVVDNSVKSVVAAVSRMADELRLWAETVHDYLESSGLLS